MLADVPNGQSYTLSPPPPPIPAPIAFKLQFESRWVHRKVFDDDTDIVNTDKPWAAVLKEMDASIVPWLRSKNINNYMPYKIRALLTSIGARGIRQTEAVTLTRAEGAGERWQKAMDLVRYNASSGMKDLSIAIDSIWTTDGSEPEPELRPSYEAAAATVAPSSTLQPARRHRSECSESEIALFWIAISRVWVCKNLTDCSNWARRLGVACFVHHGQHYGILVAQWRDSIEANESTLERPSRAMRKLIVRLHQEREIELQERARPAIRPTQGSPSTPATINHFYVDQPQGQEPFNALSATPDVPQPRQASPVPVELNTTANWDAFWEHHLKQTYPDWSAGLNRVKVLLEQDFWNLRILFNSSDKQLSRVIKQSGLRIVVHEEVTKFVDLFKQAQRLSQDSPNSTSRAQTSRRDDHANRAPSITSISSSVFSSSYASSDHQIRVDTLLLTNKFLTLTSSRAQCVALSRCWIHATLYAPASISPTREARFR